MNEDVMDVHIKLGAPPPFNSVHLNLISYFDLSKPSDSSCWMHFLYFCFHIILPVKDL